GQPQWASNLVSDSNNLAPQRAHRYAPGVLVSQYSPVKGRSVPFSRSTWYWVGVRSRFQSVSVFVFTVLICPQLLTAIPIRGRRDVEIRSSHFPQMRRIDGNRDTGLAVCYCRGG